MKKTYTKTAVVLAAGLSCMVSCTSLPSNISRGIDNGNAHAYYEAGKHIDDSKVAADAPNLLSLVCFPFNVVWIPVAVMSGVDTSNGFPYVESCFYYRSKASKNKEAAKYYSKGAELGDAACQYEMGLNYEKGWGVTKNQNKAIAFYTQAAQNGNADAQAKLKALTECPASIIGRNLSVTTNTEWNGLKVKVADGMMEDDRFLGFYIEYKKTGFDTAELTLIQAGTMAFQEIYNLHFTDSRHANITQGWSGANDGAPAGKRTFMKSPIKNLRGSITLD